MHRYARYKSQWLNDRDIAVQDWIRYSQNANSAIILAVRILLAPQLQSLPDFVSCFGPSLENLLKYYRLRETILALVKSQFRNETISAKIERPKAPIKPWSRASLEDCSCYIFPFARAHG